ncbi:MAG TPA: DNA primase [Candidatus Acidoferrales bacterium]|nr:DNA primase [Candidatus Acidoferrales bacterium]
MYNRTERSSLSRMAEAGSFADRVKQQADIVRVVGEYVRLKKSGQNFTGLCPFHSEKTPSFSVSPLKQFYYCFGCGAGGDVFNFVMEMDKLTFPEAVRAVAEKCGIAIPRARERTPEERRENQIRSALVDLHREAAVFFVQQLNGTQEGRAAKAYLLDRGLDSEAMARFGLGFAPSGGEALLRAMKPKYPENALEASGLFSKDQNGRLYDRFRRRVMFPIANESGKTVAFGGRAIGDEIPKYLNSPETPIYTKSNVLYNLHRAKERLREIRDAQGRYIVLVEGYVDCIRVDITKDKKNRPYNIPVVASCGTSLTETHTRLLHRIVPHVIVWYDMDSAGKAATDRSLELLLAEELEVDVYPYDSSSKSESSKSDPDTYIRQEGDESAIKPIIDPFERFISERKATAEEDAIEGELENFDTPYFDERLQKGAELGQRKSEIRKEREERNAKALGCSQPFKDFLLARAAKLFDVSRTEGKLKAVNFLLPYVQRIPNAIIRSEWATRIAQQLRIEEPVLRESMRKAASERRSEVKARPELIGRVGKPAERRLVQMLIEAEARLPGGQEFRAQLAQEIRAEELHRGLESERVFTVLVEACASGTRPDASALAMALEDRDRRLLFEIAFESAAPPTWEEAESCLSVLRRRRAEEELATVQKQIETFAAAAAAGAGGELRRLLERKQELRRRLDPPAQ